MDITAGLSKLRTQINKLERRIHNLDMDSVDANELHAAIESLNALKARYKEMEELHAKKKQEKQEKESKTIPMEKQELVKEHEHLVDVLKSPSHADDAQEAKKQEKELAEYKEATEEPKVKAPKPFMHPSFEPRHDKMVRFPRRPQRKLPKHRIVDVPAPTVPQEKESATLKFAIHDVVEPSRGTPGSKGRVMGHDEANDMVYVAWHEGKLKDSHGYGAYSSKDLKKSASLKTAIWKDHIQNVYSSLEEFKAWDETYGLSQRLGFPSSEEAWEANPLVQGSTNPADYKVVEAERGVPGSVFTAETAQAVLDQIKAGVKVPYISGNVSTLGGKEHASILLRLSLDDKKDWANGILENSRYAHISIDNDGTMEAFSGSLRMRKTNAKSVEDIIKKLNTLATPTATASLDKKARGPFFQDFPEEVQQRVMDAVAAHLGTSDFEEIDDFINRHNDWDSLEEFMQGMDIEMVEQHVRLNASAPCSVDGCKNKADSVVDGKRYCYTHSWGKDPKKMKEASLNKQAGPGAGREFKVGKDDITDGSFIYNMESGKVTWKQMPEILSFELFGYYDGMRDVDGRLLKITGVDAGWWERGQANVKADLSAVMKDWMKEMPHQWEGITGDVEVGVGFRGLEAMIGGGYMRTVLKPGDTFQACGNGYLTSNYDMYEIDMCATLQCQEEFDHFEQDVFDTPPNEPDEEGVMHPDEDWYEMHQEPYRAVRKSSLNSDISKLAATTKGVVDAFVNRTNPKAKTSNLYILDRGDRWDLVNYQTVIAQHLGDKIAVSNKVYSVTTTKIQSQIAYMASAAGIPVVDIATGKPLDHEQKRERATDFRKLDFGEPYQRVASEEATEDTMVEDMIDSEPSDEDIFIQDDRGKTHAWYIGKPIASLENDDWDAFYIAIAKWMSDNNYSPSVWMISDHGNAHLVTDIPQAKDSSLDTDGEPDAQDVVDTYINGNISDAREWVSGNPDLFPEAYELMQQFDPQGAKRFMQLVYPRKQVASLNKKATSWHVLGNGDLELTLDPETAKRFDINPEELDSDKAMYDLFEPAIANGLSWVAPESIGALTDAPILSDHPGDDQGNPEPNANYWWFPNYMVESPARTLVEQGRVIFKKASKESVNKKADENKIPLNVFDGGFYAVETSVGATPHGYAIFDPKGQQVMVVTTKAPITQERLESIVHDEYGKKQLVRATLKEDHETLKTGSKFTVSGIDRVTKEVRLKAEKEHVWVPISKVAVSAETLEQQINDMKTRMTQTQERLQQSVTTQATVDATAGTFQVGDRVTDARKGDGTVTYVSHDQITVDWDWIGQKLLGPEPIPMAKTKSLKKITTQPEVQAQVEKVADEPMPTTPAPQGMRWAFDADVRKWILVKKQGL